MPQLEQISTFGSQIFWLIVTFSVLFIIMWRNAVPRISDALEARQKRIDDQLDKAGEVKKEAEAAIAAYESALATARSDAQEAIASTNAKLAAEASTREAKLAEKITARVSESEASIAKAVDDAVANIQSVATEVVGVATRRLADEDIDDKAITAAVDAAISSRN